MKTSTVHLITKTDEKYTRKKGFLSKEEPKQSLELKELGPPAVSLLVATCLEWWEVPKWCRNVCTSTHHRPFHRQSNKKDTSLSTVSIFATYNVCRCSGLEVYLKRTQCEFKVSVTGQLHKGGQITSPGP